MVRTKQSYRNGPINEIEPRVVRCCLKTVVSAVVDHKSDRVTIPYRLHSARCTMQEPDNPTGLFEDRLPDSIKEYVFGLLPSDEQNSGIAVDVFTLCRRPYYGVGRIQFEIDVNSYCIATLTDKALRLHQLDNWWELSAAGYHYYERARKEGRHRILRHYDTVIDRYGKLYCHLPNQIGIVEIPRQEITSFSVSKCLANGHVRFHIKDNHMVDIEEFVSVKIQTSERVQMFSSIFSGIDRLVKQLE